MNYKAEIIAGLAGKENVEFDVPMSEHTSFRAGGKADVFVRATTIETLTDVIGFLSKEDIPHMVLGKGTNILVRDGGYRGVIVNIGDGLDKIDRVEGHPERIKAQAGALLTAVSKKAQESGLAGMEGVSGIPGSIGGAVFMNAGAYGTEMKDILSKVSILKADGSGIEEKNVDDLELSYRHSNIMETGDIVLEAELELEEGDPGAILKNMKEITAKRNQKQPVKFPSAGSFFKRPEGHFAGKLIQDAGLKGITVGGAKVSPMHSGFIINAGGATAKDITELMILVQGIVMDKFGVMLEPEVRIIGEE